MIEIPTVVAAFFGTLIISFFGLLVTLVLNAFKSNTEAFKNNTAAFAKVDESIKEIQLWISKKDTADGYEVKECDNRHKNVDDKLCNHERRINKLEDKSSPKG